MTNEPEFNNFDNGLRILAGMIARVYLKDKAEKRTVKEDDTPATNGDEQQLQRGAHLG